MSQQFLPKIVQMSVMYYTMLSSAYCIHNICYLTIDKVKSTHSEILIQGVQIKFSLLQNMNDKKKGCYLKISYKS